MLHQLKQSASCDHVTVSLILNENEKEISLHIKFYILNSIAIKIMDFTAGKKKKKKNLHSR